jgi:hypothetical protein
MTKEEFEREFLNLFTTHVKIELERGITFVMYPFIDKLWEIYNIERKDINGKINS